MHIQLPRIIQGGMGAGVSNWRLAQAVSRLGHLGVVSGTGLDQILVRRLQDGDPGGHVRRALAHFPFPASTKQILDALFIPGGKKPGTSYKTTGMLSIKSLRWPQELCIAANFVEVFLAREGHGNPVGINYLEKIQLPHLPSIYGAMLAGVAVVIVGAGISIEMPTVLDALANHQPAAYPIRVHGAQPDTNTRMLFDPATFRDGTAMLAPLQRPDFVPIVASDALATMLLRKSHGTVDGFVVEGPLAGGHNAPPRGALHLTADGQPVYGPRDQVDLKTMRGLGVPFWLAGAYGSAARLQEALAEGAAGIQVGTPFALCEESGLTPEVRRALVAKALSGKAVVFTDPTASPTGFPFKLAKLEGSLSEEDVYRQRHRVCDIGYLREAYLRDDGAIGYRCPAEPVESYAAKGGKAEECAGRRCLCNGLFANIGLPQTSGQGRTEPCLITLGDDFAAIGRFCTADHPEYTAADVVRVLLGA